MKESGGVEITAEVSPTRSFRITSEGYLEPWWLRIVNVETDGQHGVDPSPGLHLPFFEITAFRDLLIEQMTRSGICPPRLTLEELAQKKELSKTAVIRQALRLYQMLDARMAKGEKLFFEDEAAQKKAELMLL